jgi:hypothetical protein
LVRTPGSNGSFVSLRRELGIGTWRSSTQQDLLQGSRSTAECTSEEAEGGQLYQAAKCTELPGCSVLPPLLNDYVNGMHIIVEFTKKRESCPWKELVRETTLQGPFRTQNGDLQGDVYIKLQLHVNEVFV